MILKVYTVYDAQTGIHSHPILRINRGQAVRDFGDEMEKPNNPWAKHPADFTFFEIGEYDDNEGVFTNHEAKVSLGTALELQTRTSGGELSTTKKLSAVNN